MNEDNNEQSKNKSNKVDNLSQLYSDVLEVSRINRQYKKSDIDAINNRNNFNDNKPLGVVSSSQSTSTKTRKSSLTKKDSSLKKQDLNNSSNIFQDDKNKLSSKSEDRDIKVYISRAVFRRFNPIVCLWSLLICTATSSIK